MNSIQLQINQVRQELADIEQLVSELTEQLSQLQSTEAQIQQELSTLGDSLFDMIRREQLDAELASVQAQISQTQAELDAAIIDQQNVSSNYEQLLTDQQQQLQQALGVWPTTNAPIALLPIRLETCFETEEGQTDLLLRIYPDTIHVDTHEPELTSAEDNWGKAYWEQVWRIGTATDELAERQREMAWTNLAQRFGTRRAAWIVHVLTPLNPQDQPAGPVPADQPLPNAIQFPNTGQRSASWTRSPETQVLPHRWLALGYRNDERVLLQWGQPIPDKLAVGPDPQATGNGNGQVMDAGMQWMIDFETAESVGMAMRIPIAVEDWQEGFDKLLVFGVNSMLDEAAAATRLADLLKAHHYTDGLAFIPQGTPTNNTSTAASGHQSTNSNYSEAYGIECQAPLVSTGGQADGNIMAQALGINELVFSHVAAADATEQSDAEAMQTALWPATWEYYLEQLITPTLSVEDLRQWRDHYKKYVRANGPLPTLRIGKQPYGCLPVTSLDDWATNDDDVAVIELLRRLRNKWREALPFTPRFTGGLQAAQTMMDILQMEAVAAHYTVKPVVHNALFGTPDLPEIPVMPLDGFENMTSPAGLLEIFNLSESVRLADLVQLQEEFPLTAPLVQPATAADNLIPNYIDWLATATYNDILNENFPNEFPDNSESTNTLLYLLLRHAALLAYRNAAFRIALEQGQVSLQDRQEPVLVSILQEEPPADTPSVDPTEPEAIELNEFLQSLGQLQQLPAKKLELLLRETLDLSAHRLDAWITSMAASRLAEMRNQQAGGIYLGGFGWVEDLRPAPTPPMVPNPLPGEENQSLYLAAGNAGFVHAPSLNQATTAAILRSGYLGHQQTGSDDHPFAVDLSSRRVRLAQQILDGVRQGQSLAALLGYRFERGLHERQLDQYIESFRLLAPLGERYKAKAAVLAAQATVAELEANVHPDLPQAEADLQEKEQQKFYYSAKKNTLSSRFNSAAQAWDVLQDAEEDYQIIWNVIFQTGNEQDPTPEQQEQLDEAMEAMMAAQTDFNTKKNNAYTTMQEFRSMHQSYFSESYPLAELDMVSTVNTFSTVFVVTRANQKIDTLTTEIEVLNLEIQDMLNWEDPGLPEAREILAQKEAELEAVEDQLRERYLLPDGADVSALESIPAQNVVDGLTLLRLWQNEEGGIPFGETIGQQTVALPLSGPDYTGLVAELDQLADAVDAISDTITAESVYQMAQGNSLGAGASLDTIARGDMPPPELEVIQTPNNGINLTHRVFVLFSDVPAPSNWPVNNDQIRAGTEPFLNSWAEQLLGDPAMVQCLVEYWDDMSDKMFADQIVTLADLELSPLDVIYLANENGWTPKGEMEQRLWYYAKRNRPGEAPSSASVRLVLSRDPSWPAGTISFAEIMELARSLRNLFSHSRALQAKDLDVAGTTVAPGFDLTELQARADAAKQSFSAGIQLLTDEWGKGERTLPESLRTALVKMAYFGTPESVPQSAEGDGAEARDILLKQAETILKIVQQEWQNLIDAESAFDAAQASPEQLVEHHSARLQIILGSDFRVIPQFNLTNGGELDTVFSQSTDLQGGDPLASVDWLQQLAQVKEGVRRLDDIMLYAEALNTLAYYQLTVGQLPYQAGDRWLALPFQNNQSPASGRVSLAAHLPAGFQPTAVQAGLMIDEWVETIPQAKSTTAVSFHYNRPDSRPPQTVLLAVPPDNRTRWDVDGLEKIGLETLELCKLRTVNAEALAKLNEPIWHFLPALYFALNLNNDTASTNFLRATAPIQNQ